jgi:hypothetical protein
VARWPAPPPLAWRGYPHQRVSYHHHRGHPSKRNRLRTRPTRCHENS